MTTSETPAPTTHKVYAGNLPFDLSDEELLELFKPYGSVIKAEIRRRGNGFSFGFGFVEFENEEDAKKAIDEVNSTVVKERTIVVATARPPTTRRRGGMRGGRGRRGGFRGGRGRRGGFRGGRRGLRGGMRGRRRVSDHEERPKSTTTLLVKNIPFSFTNEDLLEFFNEYSPVSANVISTRYGRPLGFGFVEFSGEVDQKRALEGTHGKEAQSRRLVVLIATEKRTTEQNTESEQN